MLENKILNIDEILKLLPHRYPFLLVDKFEILEIGQKAIGTKNLTINEEFFQGHFPNYPIMPGVLQIEAMAQTAGLVALTALDNPKGHSVLFMSIENAKFRKPVRPGDQLKMHIEKIKERHNIYVFKGMAYVDDVLVSEAEFTAMISK